MERVDKWNVIRWLSEWHGTEVQTQDCGVIYGGFLWGVWGTPAYQVRLVVRWDDLEPLRQRWRVLTYTLR